MDSRERGGMVKEEGWLEWRNGRTWRNGWRGGMVGRGQEEGWLEWRNVWMREHGRRWRGRAVRERDNEGSTSTYMMTNLNNVPTRFIWRNLMMMRRGNVKISLMGWSKFCALCLFLFVGECLCRGRGIVVVLLEYSRCTLATSKLPDNCRIGFAEDYVIVATAL